MSAGPFQPAKLEIASDASKATGGPRRFVPESKNRFYPSAKHGEAILESLPNLQSALHPAGPARPAPTSY